MAMVTIICPETGRPVSTGIETDTETFERLPNAYADLKCPLCGRVHRWRKSDATLVDGARAPVDRPKP
jgi:hypothetical protein